MYLQVNTLVLRRRNQEACHSFGHSIHFQTHLCWRIQHSPSFYVFWRSESSLCSQRGCRLTIPRLLSSLYLLPQSTRFLHQPFLRCNRRSGGLSLMPNAPLYFCKSSQHRPISAVYLQPTSNIFPQTLATFVSKRACIRMYLISSEYIDLDKSLYIKFTLNINQQKLDLQEKQKRKKEDNWRWQQHLMEVRKLNWSLPYQV